MEAHQHRTAFDGTWVRQLVDLVSPELIIRWRLREHIVHRNRPVLVKLTLLIGCFFKPILTNLDTPSWGVGDCRLASVNGER